MRFMMLRNMMWAGNIAIAILGFPETANATCPTFHTLSNGTTADASAVMDNFNHLIECPNILALAVGSGDQFQVSSSGVLTDTGFGFHTFLAGGTGENILAVGNTTAGSGNYGGIRIRNDNNTNLVTLLGSSSTFSPSGQYLASAAILESQGVGGISLSSTTSTGTIRLYTNTTERLRIDASGNVGIGTTSPTYTLHVNGSVAGTSAYNNLSDIRLKKNIAPITGALRAVERLQGVRFTWRSPGERSVGKDLELPVQAPQIGFIAQEVGAVIPEAVTVAVGKEAIMSMQETKIVPLLVEAVKELAGTVKDVKALNENQAAQISKLQRQIAVMQTGHRDTAANNSVAHRIALAFGW